MSKNINWGILGTGRIAHSFATALAHVDDARLVAVGSRQQQSADSFAKEFAIPYACSHYSTLVEHPGIDVVYVATPHALHHENMIACLQAGKPVLCEKPFTINASEARKVIKLARDKNLFLMEAMWTRYLPALDKLRELLQNDSIGDVQMLLGGGAFMPAFDPDFYLFNPALGGGVLLDAGVYMISMASMLFGRPVSIKAMAALHDCGVDVHDAYLLQHENGALANLYVSLRGQSSPDLTLLGSKGKIYLHPPIFCPSKLTLSIYGEEPEVIDLPFEGNGYHYQVKEVHRCLNQGLTESPLMPLDESLQIIQSMDEIREQIGLRYPME